MPFKPLAITLTCYLLAVTGPPTLAPIVRIDLVVAGIFLDSQLLSHLLILLPVVISLDGEIYLQGHEDI
jgi:hypothetical protein